MQVFVDEIDKCRGRDSKIINRPQVEDTGDISGPHSHGSDRIRKLIRYNKELDKQVDLIRLNESFIGSKLETLEILLSASDSIERSTLARLTELALLCAGNYANNNCITQVGDLMINPRLILVHIKGEPSPVKKERYTPLTIQFKNRGLPRYSVGEWLQFNTILETVKEPILPHLINLLRKSGCSEGYLESVRSRMSMIITLASHLSTARIPEDMNIKDWLSSLLKDDRIFIEALFYPLDKTAFNDLGDKICSTYTNYPIPPLQAGS